MFNLFPKKKSVDEILEDVGLPTEDLYKSIKKEASDLAAGVINGVYEIIALKNELSLVEIELEAIVAANHKMAQELKEKNDRVILLENALDRWSTRAKSWEKMDEELKSNVSELTKEVLNLRHLKTENVELIERLHKEIQKKGLSFNEAKLQMVQNDYSKCAEQRDEYKHQLNAANREIEALKSKLRDYQDKYAESFSYNDMNKLQNKIDEITLMYKERDTKLKTYNGTLLGQIAGLKEENEKLNLQIVALHKIIEGAKKTIDEQKHPMYPIHWGGYDKNIKEFVESELNNEDPVEGISELLQKAKDLTEGVEVDLDKSLDEQSNESIKKFVESISCPEDDDNEICYICDKCGYKLVNDIFYYGGCGFCKEGKMVEFIKWQKNYSNDLDPEILKQAKEQSIEEIVERLKGIKTQGFEDCDLRDFVESEIKNEDPLEGKQVKDTWCYNCLYVTEQCKCNEEIEFNSEELLKRVNEYADNLNDLPKSFPDEFQEETTADNLEDKFDKGEDCLDYFKPYHCPCNMCKHAREENTEKSWEEAASDLALRVIRLEKKIEELIIGNTYGSNFKI